MESDYGVMFVPYALFVQIHDAVPESLPVRCLDGVYLYPGNDRCRCNVHHGHALPQHRILKQFQETSAYLYGIG